MNAITIKQYYLNPWQQELTTEIISHQKRNGNYLLVLEETIFYPTGGGQPCDLGTLNGEPLLDVFSEGDTIYHVVANYPDSPKVLCSLDWSRRFDHMQQHTGQHLLSAVFALQYNYETVSFHLGAEHCTIDLNTPRLCQGELILVEKMVNELILRALPIQSYTVSEDQLTSLPLRKIPEIDGDLRIVEIADYDYSPCSGTHLTTTGQLGLLKILKTENYKGMTRVYFLAGERAQADYRLKHELCTELIELLSVPLGELTLRVNQELEKGRGSEQAFKKLQEQFYHVQAELIVEKQDSPFFLELPDQTLGEASLLARSILQLGSFFVAISLQNHLVLNHNLGDVFDLGQFVKSEAPKLGGRGGGSATAAQIYFPEQKGLKDFLELLRDRVRKQMERQR